MYLEKCIHYQVKVDERLVQLIGDTVMSKLDPNSRFRQISPAQVFCELTTFILPFGGFASTSLHDCTLSENNEHKPWEASRSLLYSCCLIDDILNSGKDQKEYDTQLTSYRLRENTSSWAKNTSSWAILIEKWVWLYKGIATCTPLMGKYAFLSLEDCSSQQILHSPICNYTVMIHGDG